MLEWGLISLSRWEQTAKLQTDKSCNMKQSLWINACYRIHWTNHQIDTRMSIKKKWCHLSSVIYRKYRYNLVLNLWKAPAGMEHHFSDRYFLIYSLMVTVPLFVSYLCEHHGHQMFPVDHLSLPSYLLISFPQIYCRWHFSHCILHKQPVYI